MKAILSWNSKQHVATMGNRPPATSSAAQPCRQAQELAPVRRPPGQPSRALSRTAHHAGQLSCANRGRRPAVDSGEATPQLRHTTFLGAAALQQQHAIRTRRRRQKAAAAKRCPLPVAPHSREPPRAGGATPCARRRRRPTSSRREAVSFGWWRFQVLIQKVSAGTYTPHTSLRVLQTSPTVARAFRACFMG